MTFAHLSRYSNGYVLVKVLTSM